MKSDKIHYHPRGRVAAIVAEFYAGDVRREIADRHGLALGAVSGVLSRACAVRSVPKGREPYLFDRIESQNFVARVNAGERWDVVADSMGKSHVSARGHAAALGLIAVDEQASAKKSAGAMTRQAATMTPESIAAAMQDRFEAGDAVLVNALIAEGGFSRYDDGFDWLLNMHDERVVPISARAKGEFMDAMRAKHGADALKIAAA